MAYSKSYYEQNKERISDYNKTRRLENPEVVEKERKAYQLKVDDFKKRSKIQNLRGRLAFESLSKKKQKEIMDKVNNILAIWKYICSILVNGVDKLQSGSKVWIKYFVANGLSYLSLTNIGNIGE